MAGPGTVDSDVARQAAAGSFRRRDDAELQADLVALIGRRTDLAAVRGAELFRASIVRLQQRYGIRERVPSAAAIGAWVDAVVPPDPEMMIAAVPGAIPYAPDPNAIALLTDPGSGAIARSLLALAGRRPDLSDLQRHELFLAGLVHLVVRKAGFITQPTRKGIFIWIDLVAPERIPAADAPARGQPDLPGGTPSVPNDPAGNPSFGDIPSAGEALASTVGRPSSDSGEGLTGTAGEPGLSPPPVATGWHALTSEEATRHYVERGLSDNAIRQQLAPWLNHMTNAEYRDWEALLAELRGQGLGGPLLGREPPDFLETPDARLLAQAIAFQARHNADRMRRARLAAPAYLRAVLGREPIPVEVEAWANALFSRNDTVIEVDSLEPPVTARHETVPALQRGPGRPGWTRDLFEERWREARAATPQPHTFRALAEHFRALDGFEGGLGGEHLRKLRRKRFPE